MPEVSTTAIEIDEQVNQHVQLMQDFVDAILAGSKLTTDAREAGKSNELADGILLSAWEGKKISFPLSRTDFNSHFQDRFKNSQLRKKEELDVMIDLDKSFR